MFGNGVEWNGVEQQLSLWTYVIADEEEGEVGGRQRECGEVKERATNERLKQQTGKHMQPAAFLCNPLFAHRAVINKRHSWLSRWQWHFHSNESHSRVALRRVSR